MEKMIAGFISSWTETECLALVQTLPEGWDRVALAVGFYSA